MSTTNQLTGSRAMTNPSDGGPAFPLTFPLGCSAMIDVPTGMTLRDYFATHASYDELCRILDDANRAGDLPLKNEFQWARYQHADAMLAERARREGQSSE